MDYIEPDPPLVAPGSIRVGAGGAGSAPRASNVADSERIKVAVGADLDAVGSIINDKLTAARRIGGELVAVIGQLRAENDALRARVAALEIGMDRLPAAPASVTWCSPDATDACISFWREAIETQERAGPSPVDPRSAALARAIAADRPLDAYARR